MTSGRRAVIVNCGSGEKARTARIFFAEGCRDAFKRPCAGEVHAVQMDKFAVRPVKQDTRSEPICAAVCRDARQEPRKPSREGIWRQHAAHEIGFHQTG